MNNKIVFTALYGGYDKLRDPAVISDGWDYICFTNDKDLKSSVWKIIVMDLNLIPSIAVRYVFTHSRLLLPDHSVSLKVDSSIHIIGDLNKLMESDYYDGSKDLNLMKHPCRDCIYKEADIVVQYGIDKSGRPQEQMKRYRAEGYPENNGLPANGIVFRNNSPEVALFDELWFKEILSGSHRDQLSFQYVFWKYNLITYNTFPYNEILHSEYFNLYKHGMGDRKI